MLPENSKLFFRSDNGNKKLSRNETSDFRNLIEISIDDFENEKHYTIIRICADCF